MSTNSSQRLQGVVQHYAWGGFDFIPRLLGLPNSENQPWAEYWLGVHPKGMAVLPHLGEVELAEWLADNANERLGSTVAARFGELPFLFKVLDVRQMLSIQLHPTREVAELGFAREEAAGIPRVAPNRNYRDRNHKPEVMVALTDFWLLHGFRNAEAIEQTLASNYAWNSLRPILAAEGVAGLYRYVMELPQPEVDALLQPLQASLLPRINQLTKNQPDYWAWQAFLQYSKDGHHDRGIFSIYWFNLVHLLAGEGIFQGAGIPHAYLEGVNIELMANSDNVLRGGLTPKHIDVPELLANIRTEAVEPALLKGEQRADGGLDFPVPVPDFALARWQLAIGEESAIPALGPAIGLVLAGELDLDGVIYERGDAFFLPPAVNVKAVANEPLDLFVAYAPQ